MIPRILASLLLALALPATAVLQAQQPNADEAPRLAGRIEGTTYFSASGAFKTEIPVLPEFGGSVQDTDTAVTFHDNLSVHTSIAAVKMDATLRWEDEVRGRKEFLIWFFTNYVQSDFQEAHPGTTVQSAKFLPSTQDGSLLAYILIPGGSMFMDRVIVGTGEEPPVAKRGNLLFVKNEYVFVISIELAEKVLDRTTWNKTQAEEDDVLRKRLLDVVAKLNFTMPTPAKADAPAPAPAAKETK